jgi:hypothetical protein
MILPPEGAPSDDQKNRLENWLTELFIIARSYGLILDVDDDGELRLVDLHTNTVIGYGLKYLTATNDPSVITAYDVQNSILDGAWPIDTPTGPQEQRLAGRVHPAPPEQQQPPGGST